MLNKLKNNKKIIQLLIPEKNNLKLQMYFGKRETL
jgi:hypothetical protein